MPIETGKFRRRAEVFAFLDPLIVDGFPEIEQDTVTIGALRTLTCLSAFVELR
jgi:hypothetical protein